MAAALPWNCSWVLAASVKPKQPTLTAARAEVGEEQSSSDLGGDSRGAQLHFQKLEIIMDLTRMKLRPTKEARPNLSLPFLVCSNGILFFTLKNC